MAVSWDFVVPMRMADSVGIGVLVLLGGVILLRLYFFKPRKCTSEIKTMIVLGSGVQLTSRHWGNAVAVSRCSPACAANHTKCDNLLESFGEGVHICHCMSACGVKEATSQCHICRADPVQFFLRGGGAFSPSWEK
jgi:hypothetical protein